MQKKGGAKVMVRVPPAQLSVSEEALQLPAGWATVVTGSWLHLVLG